MKGRHWAACGGVALAIAGTLVGATSIRLHTMTAQDVQEQLGIENLHVQGSPAWLKEHVQNWLNDHCACVSQDAAPLNPTLIVSLTDHAGMFPSVRLITVSAKLQRGQSDVWSGSRDWTAAGEPAAKKAAMGLANALLSGLTSSIRLPHGIEVTRRFLQQATSVGIVEDGMDGAGWTRELQDSRCHQKIVAGKDGDAILEHVEIQSGSVGQTNSVTVNCSSTDSSVDCEDNMGGSSSVNCVGENCSASSSSGFDPSVDARPDLEITPPKFAWVFIDSKTGQTIGAWSIRKDSLASVKTILGCQ